MVPVLLRGPRGLLGPFAGIAAIGMSARRFTLSGGPVLGDAESTRTAAAAREDANTVLLIVRFLFLFLFLTKPYCATGRRASVVPRSRFCYSAPYICGCSSVVERCPDKTEVEGPIPSTRTELSYCRGGACLPCIRRHGRQGTGILRTLHAVVAELVYAYGSEPYPARVESSNLSHGTRKTGSAGFSLSREIRRPDPELVEGEAGSRLSGARVVTACLSALRMQGRQVSHSTVRKNKHSASAECWVYEQTDVTDRRRWCEPPCSRCGGFSQSRPGMAPRAVGVPGLARYLAVVVSE